MKTLEEYMSYPYRLEIVPDTAEGGYAASYPELRGCVTCADTIDEVVRLAEDAKKCWLTAAIEDGVNIPEPSSTENYSGQFKLRIPKSLHKQLSEHARYEGVSMNQYCVYLLSKYDRIS